MKPIRGGLLSVTGVPLLLLGLAGLIAATGCGGDGASTTASEPSSTASAQHRACAGGGVLSGDLDGDGKADRVTMAIRPAQSHACVYALVVHSASGTRRYGLGTRNYGPGRTGSVEPADAPTLDGLARIDRRPGFEIVADIWQGASTAFAAVFTVRSGRLVEMSAQNLPPLTPVGRAFPYSGSVTHLDGVDCAGGAGSGLIVVSRAGVSGKQWNVIRRFYRVSNRFGFLLVPSRSQRVRIPYRMDASNLSKHFPEFADRAFPSCIEALVGL
jgi:hypothetical protein